MQLSREFVLTRIEAMGWSREFAEEFVGKLFVKQEWMDLDDILDATAALYSGDKLD